MDYAAGRRNLADSPRGLRRVGAEAETDDLDGGVLASAVFSRCAKFSEHGLGPVLERILHFVQKLVSDRAVHNAVIVTQRHVAHRADGDGIVHDYRTLLDGA